MNNCIIVAKMAGIHMSASSIVQSQCNQFNILVESDITLFYPILYYVCCIKNESKCMRYCHKLQNKYILYICFSYGIIYLVTLTLFNGYYGYIRMLTMFIYFLSLLFVLLNMNYQIIYYQINTFILWWKMLNVCILMISMSVIDIYNKSYEWNDHYDRLSSIFITTSNFITVSIIGTLTLSAIEALIFKSVSKMAKYIRNTLVISGIIYFIK